MDKDMTDDIPSEEPNLPNPDELSCNLQKVYDCFNSGLVNTDDVDLEKYTTAYKELFNFFVLLGKGFGFIASDVKTKIGILENLKKEAKGDEFDTVSKMMDHEKNNNLLNAKNYVSGSRTLLRLHRGLDFVKKFLSEVSKLQDDEYTSPACRKAYDSSLANYHSWVIRKAAQLAVKLLPSKKDLLKKITKGDEALEKAAYSIMPKMLEAMDAVYQRVEKLYTKNDLHNLS